MKSIGQYSIPELKNELARRGVPILEKEYSTSNRKFFFTHICSILFFMLLASLFSWWLLRSENETSKKREINNSTEIQIQNANSINKISTQKQSRQFYYYLQLIMNFFIKLFKSFLNLINTQFEKLKINNVVVLQKHFITHSETKFDDFYEVEELISIQISKNIWVEKWVTKRIKKKCERN